MKFYIKLAAVIAIIAFILWWLQNQNEEKAAAPTAPSTTTVQATPAPTPVATPILAAATPQPDSGIGKARDIAQHMGLTFMGGREDNGWLVVTVRGRERNDLSDFLDEMIKSGMKDLDVNNKQYHQIPQRDGRVIHEGIYRIRF